MSNYKLNVEMKREISEKLGQYADARGECRSSVVRRLILEELVKSGFVDDEKQIKALGLKGD